MDCLTEDDVAAIMIAHIEKNSPRKIVVATPAKVFDGRTVQLGDLVTVAPLGGGRPRKYKVGDWLNKNHPHIFDELIGKNIGSTVTIRDGKFIITDIT